jgi:glyoxylase-like metal-dependent hydrolase (beta-lactamase superfamily II)
VIARFRLPTDTRAPHGETNAYLAGDPAVLVDPAARSLALDSAVRDRDVAHIALTHTHRDHVGSLAHYAAETDATVWCRAGRTRPFTDDTGVTPDRTYVDGTPLGDSGVTTLETPGHAPEHTAFVHADEAIVGDLCTATGSVYVGPPGGDMRAYYTSLRRASTREFSTLHPGHGDPVTDPAARLAAVLAHRLDRERRVERAVREGDARTVEQILDAAYDKDLTGFEDLAGRTVRAHLEKLSIEGRLTWDGAWASPP